MSSNITENKRRRLERNAKIVSKYNEYIQLGCMKSVVVSNLANSYRLSIPTIYSIINENKAGDK